MKIANWYTLVLVLFFAVLSIPYGIKAWHNGSAFQRWQPQISALGDGVDIAQRYNYPNPPIMALLLYPLARLPAAANELGLPEKAASLFAALCWFYIKAGLTLLAFRWVFQLVEEPSRPFPLWAKCLTVLLAMRPIMSDLQHGNVNLFILFLVVAALAAYRRQRDICAGIVLGLAIACKVTPALFVPYFLWKRAWKTLAGCVAGLILFLWPGLVPACFMGWEHNQNHLVSWYYDMVHPFVIEGKVTSEHHNQSLPGLVARLATHSPSFSTYVNNEYTPTHYDNLLDLSPAQARWLVKGCMVLFALMVVWVCRTSTTPRAGWRLSAEFSIVLLGMLLFSERTWKHHCVTLVLPFAVICYYLATEPQGRAMRAYLIGSLAATMALMATTSNTTSEGASHHDHLYQLFAKQAQVYGAFVLVYLVMLTALIILLRRRVNAIPGVTSQLSRAA
ncbi:MAG TPA: glycosyltransferase family 87 protein [Gemmataceae bacterium]|nr:glycosyltransferase family 87 protein [Gemmataceae bacterium]